MSGKQYWVDRCKQSEKALAYLLSVIDAHELVSLSCDRDGQEFCDCLEQAVKNAKNALEE